jgi:inner membrane protein
LDTISQITLGAAVGELALGKKVGNKAMLWGGVVGTIPDLDVVFNRFLDDASSVALHRGFSHSILFAIILAPILAYLISKIHGERKATRKDWIYLVFWATLTHPLLDCFTTYGTQLFNPFSTYPVAFSTISVIDPVYTIPFFICVILSMFFRRTPPRRRLITLIGLSVSSLYLCLTVVNKLHVTSVFEDSLRRQGIAYSRLFTGPTLFNNILWHCVAEGQDQFWEGYYSLLDADHDIRFYPVARNHELIEPYRDDLPVTRLIRFTKGYYAAAEDNGDIIINDLRYGRANGWVNPQADFVFSFSINPEASVPRGDLDIQRKVPNFQVNAKTWEQFVERIKGKESHYTY